MDVLTIEVPEEMVQEVQAKINNLFSQSDEEQTPEKESRNNSGSKQRSTSRK